MLIIEREDPLSLVTKYVEVFSVLHVPSENWLTKREKEYFVANVILKAEGIDLSSRRCSIILEKRFGFINRGVSVYRSKLKDKGWLVQTSLGLDLPRAFDFSKGNIPKELSFSFKVKLKDG